MQITGTVEHQNISGGFWSIIGDDGKKWRPEKMPQSLRQEGLRVTISAKELEEGASIFMWGTSIEILEFTLLQR